MLTIDSLTALKWLKLSHFVYRRCLFLWRRTSTTGKQFTLRLREHYSWEMMDYSLSDKRYNAKLLPRTGSMQWWIIIDARNCRQYPLTNKFFLKLKIKTTSKKQSQSNQAQRSQATFTSPEEIKSHIILTWSSKLTVDTPFTSSSIYSVFWCI